MLDYLQPSSSRLSKFSSFKLPYRSFPRAIHILLLFLSIQCHPSTIFVRAEANVTVDDGDGSIGYFPTGAWAKSEQTSLNFGGSHMLTQNPNATAVFNFTGTAIYFMSPLWPYKVNTAISLDSSPPTLVDLVDYSTPDVGQGPETAASRVVWNATGLANTQHTLQISVGASQSFAVVDGLIYTDPSASPSSSSLGSGPTRIVASPSYSTEGPSSRSKSAVPIAVGVLFGLLGLAIVGLGIWYFWWKRRRPASEASGYPAQNMHPPGGGYGNGYTYGYGAPPSAYVYGQAPYPQYAYGSGYYGETPVAGGIPGHPGVPPNRAPNRYQPGFTLSTITEKSTPQMADGTRTMPGTPMSGAAAAAALGAHSPGSIQSELGYYTAPGSSVGQHSPAPGAGGGGR